MTVVEKLTQFCVKQFEEKNTTASDDDDGEKKDSKPSL
jgi:hypothetical protein